MASRKRFGLACRAVGHGECNLAAVGAVSQRVDPPWGCRAAPPASQPGSQLCSEHPASQPPPSVGASPSPLWRRRHRGTSAGLLRLCVGAAPLAQLAPRAASAAAAAAKMAGSPLCCPAAGGVCTIAPNPAQLLAGRHRAASCSCLGVLHGGGGAAWSTLRASGAAAGPLRHASTAADDAPQRAEKTKPAAHTSGADAGAAGSGAGAGAGGSGQATAQAALQPELAAGVSLEAFLDRILPSPAGKPGQATALPIRQTVSRSSSGSGGGGQARGGSGSKGAAQSGGAAARGAAPPRPPLSPSGPLRTAAFPPVPVADGRASTRQPSAISHSGAQQQPPAEATDDAAAVGEAPVKPQNSEPHLWRQRVVSIALDVARGLEYLHPTVVHRDLTPGNVLVNHPGSPHQVAKLSDFGLARLRNTAAMWTENPEAGTPEYMAPELYNVDNYIVTHKVDVYSFGVLLWAMLTGKRPWAGLKMVVIAYRVNIEKARPPLDDVPRHRLPRKLARLMLQCWEADPARRPAAAELVKGLLLLREQMTQGGVPCADSAAAAAASGTGAPATTTPAEGGAGSNPAETAALAAAAAAAAPGVPVAGPDVTAAAPVEPSPSKARVSLP